MAPHSIPALLLMCAVLLMGILLFVVGWRYGKPRSWSRVTGTILSAWLDADGCMQVRLQFPVAASAHAPAKVEENIFEFDDGLDYKTAEPVRVAALIARGHMEVWYGIGAPGQSSLTEPSNAKRWWGGLYRCLSGLWLIATSGWMLIAFHWPSLLR
jgi:hypothetical protein